jgi:hypothetical protein
MKHHYEGKERRRPLIYLPVKNRRNDDRMAKAGDREKFGGALHHCKKHRGY